MEMRPSVSRAAWLTRMAAWDWRIVALILVLKVLLFVLAYENVEMLGKKHGGFLEIWSRWDATHYLHLAREGYFATGPDRVEIAFFPFYPWLVRAAAFVARDYVLAAFLISGVASIATGLLLQRLARFDHSKTVALTSVWLLFIFPTSLFLHIGYTESTFLAFTIGSFVAARKERWAVAGLLGACAAFTRVNGLFLLPALAVEAWTQFRAQRRFDWRWLWIGAVSAGLAGYLLLNYKVTGDFFSFAKIQNQNWYKHFSPPWVGLRELYLRARGLNPIEGFHELVFVVLTFAAIFWSAATQRPSYAVWITCNWLFMTSVSFVLSVPRYALTLFPIFLLLAEVCAKRRLLLGTVTAACLLFLGLYATRFTQGLWAF